MYLLYCCLFVGLLYAFRVARREARQEAERVSAYELPPRSKGDMWSIFALNLFTFGIIASAVACAAGAALLAVKPTEVVWDTYPLVSLHHNDTIEGSFVLGTGSIRQQRYYWTFRETTNGYIQSRYPTYMTYIQETDAPPHVDIVVTIRPKWAAHWSIPVRLSQAETKRYILYVPDGTIIREFSLDE